MSGQIPDRLNVVAIGTIFITRGNNTKSVDILASSDGLHWQRVFTGDQQEVNVHMLALKQLKLAEDTVVMYDPSNNAWLVNNEHYIRTISDLIRMVGRSFNYGPIVETTTEDNNYA